jgi:dTDP-4-dehydrorhamnose 3,5-epimerase
LRASRAQDSKELFEISKLEIPEVLLIHANAFPDQRGTFVELYKRSTFKALGIEDEFLQDNYSCSARGVIRGMHYQMHPKAQAKLVTVIRGEIYDVALDMRTGSPTYGKWVGVELSAKEHGLIYVPVGFAHGFQVLSEQAEVVYKVSQEYSPELERGVAWNDPALDIPWPIQEAILSPRDLKLPLLADAESNVEYQDSSR